MSTENKSCRIPSENEFPITFKRALRIAIGGRSVSQRQSIFREWWRSKLRWSANARGVQFIDSSHEAIEGFKATGVDIGWLGLFRHGIAEYRANKAIEQRRNAANARWEAERASKKPKNKALSR